MITHPIIDEDFFSSGKPTWQTAYSGISCIDVSNGIKYTQKTQPYGKNWVKVSEFNIVSIGDNDDSDSLLLMGG